MHKHGHGMTYSSQGRPGWVHFQVSPSEYQMQHHIQQTTQIIQISSKASQVALSWKHNFL